jgi:hypothetical protein
MSFWRQHRRNSNTCHFGGNISLKATQVILVATVQKHNTGHFVGNSEIKTTQVIVVVTLLQK